MWLRTTMSYQHVHGVSMVNAISELYQEGGILRFYHGIIPALIMLPLARFGDVFCNEAAREFFSNLYSSGIVTAIASTAAAFWRILIFPVDTVKTLMQVHGEEAMPLLRDKFRKMGFRALYEGSLGSAIATWVGHYPWFVTHNFLEAWCIKHMILDAHIANAKGLRRHIRRAFVGLSSSLVSDVCSNVIRVLKTYKQTSAEPMSYTEAATHIYAKSGLWGLFFRGLLSRIFGNALNAMLFTVLWKFIAEHLAGRKENLEKKEVLNEGSLEFEAIPSGDSTDDSDVKDGVMIRSGSYRDFIALPKSRHVTTASSKTSATI